MNKMMTGLAVVALLATTSVMVYASTEQIAKVGNGLCVLPVTQAASEDRPVGAVNEKDLFPLKGEGISITGVSVEDVVLRGSSVDHMNAVPAGKASSVPSVRSTPAERVE